ncbi:MAG TPA: hypothetical protein VK612_05755 [Pyrinomonadaceae bacterium]|nr:hypothetical protein [Pyrinomonadaceae bacterium]
MGQIVIDIPTNKRRHYALADADAADALLEKLDSSAVRLKKRSEKLTRQQLQDLKDGKSADRVVAEFGRTGISYTVDEIRKRYGL